MSFLNFPDFKDNNTFLYLTSDPIYRKKVENTLDQCKENIQKIKKLTDKRNSYIEKIKVMNQNSVQNENTILVKSIYDEILEKIKKETNSEELENIFKEDFKDSDKQGKKITSKSDNKITTKDNTKDNKEINVLTLGYYKMLLSTINNIYLKFININEKNTFKDTVLKSINVPKTGGNNSEAYIPPEEYKNKKVEDLKEYKYNLKYNPYFYDSELKAQDIVFFIVIIFFIRIISLILLRILIDIEFIKTFEESLFFYTFLYILFFGIIYLLVNMTHDINSFLKFLPHYMYYFYSTTNGYYRLIFHISILLIILIIPLLIKSEQNDDIYNENNLKYKKNLYKEISTFSLILWIFLTILALIIK
jgi:hypothetical protein